MCESSLDASVKCVFENKNYDTPVKLKILSLNVCGLCSKLCNPDFINYLVPYDIFCFTETKLDEYDDVCLEGYKLLPLVNHLNCKSKSGGICVFVRDTLFNMFMLIKILLVQVIVYFGFQLMTDYYLLKHCLELFIFHLKIVYIVTSNVF